MSMPNIVKTSGPGYSGGQVNSIPAFHSRDGHPEVVALYNDFTAPGAQVKNWAFRKRIIQLATKLISGKNNWFIALDSDTRIQEYNYEFILDTVRFIATGKRRISIYSWPLLISHPEDNVLKGEHSEIRKLFKELALSTSHTVLIQKWCQQPGGIDDLMFSLNILFGDRRVRDLDSTVPAN